MKKKGFQLSISVLVIIIIGLVMVGLGIVFLNKFIGGSLEIKEQLDQRTEQQLAILLESGERIALPFNTVTLSRGDSKIFGLGVLNVEKESHKYKIVIELVDGYISDYTPIADIDGDDWLLYDQTPKDLEPSEQYKMPILVEVPSDAVSGTYIFNVKVLEDSSEVGLKKMYITVA